jgi:hypothetical protein
MLVSDAHVKAPPYQFPYISKIYAVAAFFTGLFLAGFDRRHITGVSYFGSSKGPLLSWIGDPPRFMLSPPIVLSRHRDTAAIVTRIVYDPH